MRQINEKENNKKINWEMSNKNKMYFMAIVVLLTLVLMILIVGYRYFRTPIDKAVNTTHSSFQIAHDDLAELDGRGNEQTSEDPAVSVFENYGMLPFTSPPIGPVPYFINTEELTEIATALRSEVRTPTLAVETIFTENNSGNQRFPIAIETIEEEAEILELPVFPELPIEEPVEVQWISPQVHAHQSSILLGHGEVFEPSKYFSVIVGTDEAPTIYWTHIDTQIIGDQTLIVSVTDRRQQTVQLSIPVIVNQAPTIQISQMMREYHIGQEIDLLRGVSAMHVIEGNLTDKLYVETNLDPNKEGEYYAVYSVNDQFGFSASVKVTIRIKNDPPVIEAPDFIEHQILQPFSILDFVSAFDTEDGEIPLNEENILSSTVDIHHEGTYYVKIGGVQDSHGKFAKEKMITVKVTNEPPTIENTIFEVSLHAEITPDMYLYHLHISDREDSREQMTVILDMAQWQQVDTTQAGDYKVTITATDSMGATTTVVGIIRVLADGPTLPENQEFDAEKESIETEETVIDEDQKEDTNEALMKEDFIDEEVEGVDQEGIFEVAEKHFDSEQIFPEEGDDE
ncbi:immunoglobulin-like domain-containing protein [Enterococcus casseliflavus]|uniref:immunoglobulin-like domain-containing protein n=1 Tax=Enterococcus casseliflavus TaxID=37734 RepID=UPI0034D2D849